MFCNFMCKKDRRIVFACFKTAYCLAGNSHKLCKFFFVAPEAYDKEDKFVRKNWKEDTAADMMELVSVLEKLDDFSVESQKAVVDPWTEETGKRPWNAWRVALVGTGQGPDMYELSAFLGKEETLRRFDFALEQLP